jgi:hypothetical protein
MPSLEDFERQKREFSDQVSRAPNEALENTLRYGDITASRWKVHIVWQELKARQREGMYDPTPAVPREPQPKAPADRPTAWARILNGGD